MSDLYSKLPYNPKKLQRELKKFYISCTDEEIKEMLKEVGLKSLEELYDHIPKDVKFNKTPDIGKELNYNALIEHVINVSQMNKPKLSFLGDGLSQYQVPPIVPYVCSLRGLTTAYTPYQPERSQGTLWTLWNYSSALSMLTGFEAINASLYDRASGLYEAMQTAVRIQKNKNKVLVASTFYPEDIKVLKTHAEFTEMEVLQIPIDNKTGTIDLKSYQDILEKEGAHIAAVAFSQENCFGNLEDVHTLTNLAHQRGLLVIANIDPMNLSTGGLIPPIEYGEKGADIIIGEGQHLAIGPNYGGPGIGIFGIRYNKDNKLNIRSTPGRYIGKTVSNDGKEALCMVLSTREQHIRRDKATSNICSNQSFLATLVGAAILNRGEKGMSQAIKTAQENCQNAVKNLLGLEGISLAFPNSPFFNQVTLKLDKPIKEILRAGNDQNIQCGIDVSSRINGGENLLLISFSDIHSDKDISKLVNFFSSQFSNKKSKNETFVEIPKNLKRKTAVNLPNFSYNELKEFYDKLDQQNISPDNSIYPLGSCTMKYNPYINDFAASLDGFTQIHPESPEEDAQGCLKILFEIQEDFKKITNLAGVTTTPVAGAQGELVGLKLFQAYHNDRGEGESRNIILIPSSAHGTNPATATMAGFETKIINSKQAGVVTLKSLSNGQMDMEHLNELIRDHGPNIAGIMVTNPNTSGVFETNFRKMAELIHQAGGLVYMDGANMNAIASWVDLNALGVDAVHNNLHKTWTIPHGGGGPGDGIVAVSERLLDYLPGVQVILENNNYKTVVPKKTIGNFHRHFGNFAHKVRCYTYMKALGSDGVKMMSAVAVLSARYLFQKLKNHFPTLPFNSENEPRMHEFILTITPELFSKIEKAGTPKAKAIARIGKLFLDFGLHAPTVAFPEVYGLMIEPTESFSKKELDRFIEIVLAMKTLLNEHPEVLTTVPHFTPIGLVDEVLANKELNLSGPITKLGTVYPNRISPEELGKMNVSDIVSEILKAHKNN